MIEAPLFPAEKSGCGSRLEPVERFAVGRVAVDGALLLVVDGVGHVEIAPHGVDREAVVKRAAARQNGAQGQPFGRRLHAPDPFVEPVEPVARAVDGQVARAVAVPESEPFFDGEGLRVDAAERRSFVAVGRTLVAAVGVDP